MPCSYHRLPYLSHKSQLAGQCHQRNLSTGLARSAVPVQALWATSLLLSWRFTSCLCRLGAVRWHSESLESPSCLRFVVLGPG